MVSILNEVTQLRKNKSMNIDCNNSNRYRVVFNEDNGTKTAYYFSVPIYNNKTRKVVDLKFHKKEGRIYSVGSNADIHFSDKVTMKNMEGNACISLQNNVFLIKTNELASGNHRIYPTVNGFMYKIDCSTEKSFSFTLEVEKPFMQVRNNNKYFSLMSEKFKPFITISCIGTADGSGEIIAPAKISYQKLNDSKYQFTIEKSGQTGKYILIEANLHDSKFIQDTTVESANPKSNNAFGGTAFIGNTNEYGEQWLYSRPDFDKLTDLYGNKIINATLHLPKHNRSDIQLQCFKVSTRFCSFGSNWGNKISAANPISDSSVNGKYQSINLTGLVIDEFGNLTRSNGVIIRTKNKDSGFSVVATGDSFYAPQILEINYK